MRRVGHSLRGEDHQHAVAIGVGGGHLQGLGVALRGRVANDVDGIVVAPGGRQHGVVSLHGGRREFGQFAATHHKRVSRQYAGTAGIGDDG